VIQYGSSPRGDGSKRARRLSRGHLSDPGEAMPHPLHREFPARMREEGLG
jgi:hypothetical protein